MAEWVPLGDRAVRFRRPRGISPRSLLDQLRAWPGVVDVVVARDDVAIYFSAEPRVPPGSIDALTGLRADGPSPRLVEIPAVYDGPDLAAVAAVAGMTIDDVAHVHASATYDVETIGFTPGFAYLTGLDPRLHLPRRNTPRTRVPAGSIAVGGDYTGVYPFESPGGWHLIGRVAGVRMFDAAGARLQLGDRVRFVR